ncbi:MAG: hypothetical protein CME04_01900 [Gemmatimonadaceae bacterium]|nr:hypothetical protein [Gemmatimonadaceae bacterium]
MNCFQCERNLSAYLDDELPMDERLEIETHLDGCETCRTEFESHQKAWEAAHQSTAEAAPEGLWQGIENQMDDGGRADVEDLTLMVKGLAAEIGDLRRTVDDLRTMMQPAQWAEAGTHTDAYGREATEDIRVRTNPFRAVHPRDARQPASIEQLRQSS